MKFFILKIKSPSQVWLSMSVMLVLGRQRQEDGEFQASLGYT